MPDLTVTEVAKILNVSTRAVRYFIEAGRLNAYKLNPYSENKSRYRVTQASVDAFIAARQAAGRSHHTPKPPQQ